MQQPKAQHFNPRSPHGERPSAVRHGNNLRDFNPRSPHGERHDNHVVSCQHCQFQPTLPARGATVLTNISVKTGEDFNPRSPHGERLVSYSAHSFAISTFQPTLPARGATARFINRHAVRLISTHAPRTGSDKLLPSPSHCRNISTHAPRTGSDCKRAVHCQHGSISTHAPRTGSDPRGERWHCH